MIRNVESMQRFIFFKPFDGIGDWEILFIFNRPCMDLEFAIKYIKHNQSFLVAVGLPYKIGLATFEQMLLDNTEWDNL